MERKIKVVLDTNIFIKGMYTSDIFCKKILILAKNKKLQLLFSQLTIGELIYVLKGFARRIYNEYKAIYTIKDLKDIMELFYYGTTVDTRNTNSPIINDSSDNMFLECAIKGQADYLITNDFRSGMHEVKNYDFRVVSAQEFIDENYSVNDMKLVINK